MADPLTAEDEARLQGAIKRVAEIRADMERCQDTPDDEWGGHKGVYLANLEGVLGGMAPGLALLGTRALTTIGELREALERIAAMGDRVEDGTIICCEPRELEDAASLARAALTPTQSPEPRAPRFRVECEGWDAPEFQPLNAAAEEMGNPIGAVVEVVPAQEPREGGTDS
jgi:hypothetical protein